MKIKAVILSMVAGSVLSACTNAASYLDGLFVSNDVTRDTANFMQPGHLLPEMIAGVWVDGNGCEHWIIDDGIEGYMSTRWGPDGKPYCPPGNVAFSTKGFKRTSFFSSSMEVNGRRNVPGEYTSVPADRHFVNTNGAPVNVGGVLPFQNYVPDADINETYGLTYQGF